MASETLRQLIKRVRSERRLSQEELARRSSLSLPALRKIERGTTAEPGIFTVLAILRALDLSVSELEGLNVSRSQQDAES
ncbi:helix-turn-helix transcriptional regulator [Arthrobacter sp. SLBN-53]|uniref:helix-turn-helix domain-containing protein n=1 Tax=Arthrobacter sp. SLBN-53 TaxID=2768412 RepID=UPI00114FE1F0|nr:helix-turn-helix protein [Arthrobacter sp. SLBN-53]